MLDDVCCIYDAINALLYRTQESSGTYTKYLQSWHTILRNTDDIEKEYVLLHQHVVRVLVMHYHRRAEHSGEKDAPYETNDFHEYRFDAVGMLDLLVAIERRDAGNFHMHDTDEKRVALVKELARAKWQVKPPAPETWYISLILPAHRTAFSVRTHPHPLQDVRDGCPEPGCQGVELHLQPGSPACAGAHMRAHVLVLGVCV
jgi:hypothetical protein